MRDPGFDVVRFLANTKDHTHSQTPTPRPTPDHTHSTPSPGGCSGQRACTHAQLGISETAHGPTLEYRQLLHSLTAAPLTHCRMRDPGFDVVRFLANTKEKIPVILGAYLRGDAGSLKALGIVGDEMLERMQGQMSVWQKEGEVRTTHALLLAAVCTVGCRTLTAVGHAPPPCGGRSSTEHQLTVERRRIRDGRWWTRRSWTRPT
jgi:predicted lipid-binding transport protein (Tim44 family)